MTYLAPFGWGALIAGLLLRLFQPDREPWWASLLLAGLVLSVAHLFARWEDLVRLAAKRGARYGANLGLLILLVAGIVVAINYLASRHNKRWDLTASQQYTLSDQTVSVLSNLDRDLKFVVFNRLDQAQEARDLLTEFAYHSNRISVEVIDQEAEPAKALPYQTSTESNIPLGTIVIDSGAKVERVSVAAEQDLVNAVIRVIKEGRKRIYFVEGHGEKDIDASATSSGLSIIKTKLEESNYEVVKFHPLETMEEAEISVPEDAGALIIAGPQRDYLPPEIDMLRGYLEEGGKVLFLIDPDHQDPKPNLAALLERFNVFLGDNVVIDASGVGQLFGFGPDVPLVTDYSSFHPITEKFTNTPTVYPFVRSVGTGLTEADNIIVTTLIRSSPNSWAEEDFDELAGGRARPDADERPGPIEVAVALTIEVEAREPSAESAEVDEDSEEVSPPGASDGDGEPELGENGPKGTRQGRAVVVGDSDFISDGMMGAPVANLDLFLNMVNWVTEDEDLISIRPREAEDRRIFMNQQQQKNVVYLSLLIIPGIVLATGISVWWGRR